MSGYDRYSSNKLALDLAVDSPTNSALPSPGVGVGRDAKPEMKMAATERPLTYVEMTVRRLPVAGVIGNLLRRTTLELVCNGCPGPRYVIVDMLALLDLKGPNYGTIRLDGMPCKVCGAKLKQTGGLTVPMLQHIGSCRGSRFRTGATGGIPPSTTCRSATAALGVASFQG